jgi:hypothetical protein
MEVLSPELRHFFFFDFGVGGPAPLLDILERD